GVAGVGLRAVGGVGLPFCHDRSSVKAARLKRGYNKARGGNPWASQAGWKKTRPRPRGPERVGPLTKDGGLWLHLPACPGSRFPFAWVPPQPRDAGGVVP